MPIKGEKYHLMPYSDGWRVMADNGTFYSNKALTKERAKAQMRALYAKQRRGEILHGSSYSMITHGGRCDCVLKGSGWLGDVFTKVKTTLNNAIGAVKNRAVAVSRGIRNNYPPSARKTIAEFGDGIITHLKIRRQPIKSFLNQALNLLTLGQWNPARKELAFDRLYHLSLIATIRTGTGAKDILMEKNEVINISPDYYVGDDMEYFDIPVPCCVTLRTFLDRAQGAGGADYFKYDAFTNNCQMFINLLLDANNLNSPEARAFVLQDVGQLLKKLPGYTSKFARALTDVAGVANVAIFGEGHGKGTHRENFLKAHKLEDKSYSLDELAKISSVPVDILQQVYDRGIGAYRSQGKSVRLKGSFVKNVDAPMKKKLSKEQWAYARVYSFLDGNPAHDEDLRRNKGGAKPVVMSQKDYFEEHKKLVALLDDIAKKLKSEADTQATEARTTKRKLEGRSTKMNGGVRLHGLMLEDVHDLHGGFLSRAEYEARGAKMPYDDYLKAYEARQRSLASNPAEEARMAKERSDLAESNKAYEADPSRHLTKCNITAGLERGSDVVGQAECGQRHKDYDEKVRNSTTLGKVVSGLVKAGDYVAENVPLPGVGKIVGEVYKKFAPRGSKFAGAGGCMCGCGGVRDRFQKQLEKAGLTPKQYLDAVRANAKSNGYDPKIIEFSDDDQHKIMVTTPDGRKVRFGRVGYGDFLIWSAVDAKKAQTKRATFRKSHGAIKGDWKKDKFSPNSLAIGVLW